MNHLVLDLQLAVRGREIDVMLRYPLAVTAVPVVGAIERGPLDPVPPYAGHVAVNAYALLDLDPPFRILGRGIVPGGVFRAGDATREREEREGRVRIVVRFSLSGGAYFRPIFVLGK